MEQTYDIYFYHSETGELVKVIEYARPGLINKVIKAHATSEYVLIQLRTPDD